MYYCMVPYSHLSERAYIYQMGSVLLLLEQWVSAHIS